MPDKYGQLSAEDGDRIEARLKEMSLYRKDCPECQKGYLELINRLVSSIQVSMSGQIPSTLYMDEELPVSLRSFSPSIMRMCLECGFVRYHSLLKLYPDLLQEWAQLEINRAKEGKNG